jgi:hypothetical protein
MVSPRFSRIRFKMEPNLRYNLLKRSGSFLSLQIVSGAMYPRRQGVVFFAIFNLIEIFQLDCLRGNPPDTFRLSAMIVGDDPSPYSSPVELPGVTSFSGFIVDRCLLSRGKASSVINYF